MKTRNLLLASTALALLGGAQTAQADMYISVFGGANFLEDSSGATVPGVSTFLNFQSDADTGFVLGGAVGTHLDKWAKGLRAELEASYRRQDVGGAWSSSSDSPTFTGAIDANQSTFAIMANVWYDINAGWKVMPYVGGGVGWARSKVDGAALNSTTSNTFTDQENGFAWQLGAGFNYEVQPGVKVGLGYRYFQGPDNELYFCGKNVCMNTEFDNGNHSVLVNLNIDIN